MRVILNGEPCETAASSLEALVDEIGLADAVVATAVNGEFVAVEARAETTLQPGYQIEVLAPMQGG